MWASPDGHYTPPKKASSQKAAYTVPHKTSSKQIPNSFLLKLSNTHYPETHKLHGRHSLHRWCILSKWNAWHGSWVSPSPFYPLFLLLPLSPYTSSSPKYCLFVGRSFHKSRKNRLSRSFFPFSHLTTNHLRTYQPNALYFLTKKLVFLNHFLPINSGSICFSSHTFSPMKTLSFWISWTANFCYRFESHRKKIHFLGLQILIIITGESPRSSLFPLESSPFNWKPPFPYFTSIPEIFQPSRQLPFSANSHLHIDQSVSSTTLIFRYPRISRLQNDKLS